MRPTFLVGIALLLKAINAQKGDANSPKEMTLSKSETDFLEAFKDVDMDMLKELSSVMEGVDESTIASGEQVRHGHRRSRKFSRDRSVRQLHDGRELQEENFALVLDTTWLLFCGTFVFFMHAGFAMLEAGTGRSKNVQAILIKNLLTVCMGTLGWYTVGWSIAYGGDVKTIKNWVSGEFEDCPKKDNPMGCGDGYADNGFFGGASMLHGSGFLGKGKKVDKLWAEGVIDPASNGGGQAYMWFFQWAFCTASASIVSGGIAERVKFPAYMFYSFVMTSWIYPVIVCSTWGYGWLETWQKDKAGNPVGGYIDFAGSGVVHLCGGIGALAGAVVVGRRAGRFEPGMEAEFHPHSQPLIVLGTFILWFGWCGFNSGSTLGMSSGGTALVAAHVMMNTTLSASTGAMVVFILTKFFTGYYDAAALCNGILAGLVSITAGCSNVESGSAVAIGAIGGGVYFSSSLILQFAMIDDPVDAFSVHGACGIWGCLAAALFDFGHNFNKHHGWGGFSATSWEEDGGVKYMTTWDALTVNIVEAVFIINWSGGISFFLFGSLRLLGVLRVNDEKQETGCDVECRSPKAYAGIVPVSDMPTSIEQVPNSPEKQVPTSPEKGSTAIVPAPPLPGEVAAPDQPAPTMGA